jgi:hypothetical protein
LKLPTRTDNQTIASYLRMYLPLLQRCADAAIPQAEIRARLVRPELPRISAQT